MGSQCRGTLPRTSHTHTVLGERGGCDYYHPMTQVGRLSSGEGAGVRASVYTQITGPSRTGECQAVPTQPAPLWELIRPFGEGALDRQQSPPAVSKCARRPAWSIWRVLLFLPFSCISLWGLPQHHLGWVSDPGLARQRIEVPGHSHWSSEAILGHSAVGLQS